MGEVTPWLCRIRKRTLSARRYGRATGDREITHQVDRDAQHGRPARPLRVRGTGSSRGYGRNQSGDVRHRIFNLASMGLADFFRIRLETWDRVVYNAHTRETSALYLPVLFSQPKSAR